MTERNLVFLSYAHPDLEVVKKIDEGLTKRKLNVWFDKKRPEPGKWKPRIKRAIGKSRYFLFCMSKSSLERLENNKGFVCEEVDFAVELAMAQAENIFNIIPIKLEECENEDLRISSYQIYNLYEDFEGTLDKLAIQMGGISLSDANAKDERSENKKLSGGLFGKFYIEYFSQNFSKALDLISVIISLNPDEAKIEPLLYLLRGMTFNRLEKPEEALINFNKAIELKPDFIEAWKSRGDIFVKLEKFKKALINYNKAIELKPDSADIWSDRGVVLDKLGKPEKALKNYKKAIALKPNFVEVWNNLGIVLDELKKPEEALKSYEEAINLNPNSAAPWNNRGAVLIKLERNEEALKNLDEAIRLDSNFAKAWMNRGCVLDRLGKTEEALKSHEKAIKLKPEHADAWYNRGILLDALGKPEEALKNFDEAIRLNSNDANSWYERGKVLKKLGRQKEADNSFKKVENLKKNIR